MGYLSFFILGICIIGAGYSFYQVHICNIKLKRGDYASSINHELFKWVDASENIEEMNRRFEIYLLWDVIEFIDNIKGPTTFEEVLKELKEKN